MQTILQERSKGKLKVPGIYFFMIHKIKGLLPMLDNALAASHFKPWLVIMLHHLHAAGNS